MLVVTLCYDLFSVVFAANDLRSENITNVDDFLLCTGMIQSEVDEMDPDIKAYIVNDLRQNVKNGDIECIDVVVDNTAQTYGLETLTGITYSASAYKSGSTIYIYPTYEFTTYKKPVGEDAFGVSLGSAFSASSFGGNTWYKTQYMASWKANSTVLNPPVYYEYGAIYSGSQIGNAVEPILVKACTSCKATAGEGTSKKISVTYMHNPKKYDYSYSISGKALGVSFSSSKTIYASSKIFTLTY